MNPTHTTTPHASLPAPVFTLQPADVPPHALAKAISHTSISALRHHPAFTDAKAGNHSAALDVVQTLAHPDRARSLLDTCPGAVLVAPVLAIERTGVNMLPLAYAKWLASLQTPPRASWTPSIIQSNVTHHTDADAIHRLLYRPEFSGPVEPGRPYIVLDDVITSGSTVQALRLYIERHGGHVIAFTCLAASYSTITGSSLQITPTENTLHALQIKFDSAALETLLRETGVADYLSELTNCQARYLLSFRSLDTLRDRLLTRHHSHSLQATRHPLTTPQMTFAFA